MQTAALIIAVLLAVIIILLIVLLIRTRRRMEILLEEEEDIPIVALPVTLPPISRYPLYDLRRQPPGILNIPPPPKAPVLFHYPNGSLHV